MYQKILPQAEPQHWARVRSLWPNLELLELLAKKNAVLQRLPCTRNDVGVIRLPSRHHRALRAAGSFRTFGLLLGFGPLNSVLQPEVNISLAGMSMK